MSDIDAHNIQQSLAIRAEGVEMAIADYLNHASVNPQIDQLFSIMRYASLGKAKRIRAILTIEVAYILAGDNIAVQNNAMKLAVAIEMLHAYSLIHDDLPAMDNSDLRRGQTTAHIKFGEAEAILAGDALLTEAFACISGLDNIEADKIVKLTQSFAKATGAIGMVGGQMIDIDMEKGGKAFNLDDLRDMHRRKTGALISFAAEAGAILGAADKEQMQRIAAYATNLGLAFQIIDDVLDYTGDTAALGKPKQLDQDNDKLNFVKMMGLDASQLEAEKLITDAKTQIKTFGNKASFLCDLADYMLARTW